MKKILLMAFILPGLVFGDDLHGGSIHRMHIDQALSELDAANLTVSERRQILTFVGGFYLAAASQKDVVPAENFAFFVATALRCYAKKRKGKHNPLSQEQVASIMTSCGQFLSR